MPITDPGATDRVAIYTRFLLPTGVAPLQHKTIETTDIMLQMVASSRGLAALPRWQAQEDAAKMDVVAVPLGPQGIPRPIHLGSGEAGLQTDYLQDLVEPTRYSSAQAASTTEANQV